MSTPFQNIVAADLFILQPRIIGWQRSADEIAAEPPAAGDDVQEAVSPLPSSPYCSNQVIQAAAEGTDGARRIFWYPPPRWRSGATWDLRAGDIRDQEGGGQ